MKAQVQISDDLYDHFISQAEGIGGMGKSVSAEELMADRLGRFKDVEPGDRVIVIDSKTRAKLEGVLGHGSLLDAQDLLKKVQALADVQIGEIKLDFTAAEAARLKRWGDRCGVPFPQLLKDTVAKIKLGLFDYSG